MMPLVTERQHAGVPVSIFIRANTVPKTIKCPRCGELLQLPANWENSQLRAGSPHGSVPPSTLLRIGELVLNPATHEAMRAGKAIALSPTQTRLLELLMRRPGHVVSRRALIHSVSDSTGDLNNLISVFISQLRKKVDRGHKTKLIKTVQKSGYTIRDPAKAR
jgi:DNA-binding response OmpR family regulator